MCVFGFRIFGVSDLGIGVRMAKMKGNEGPKGQNPLHRALLAPLPAQGSWH